ncbi:hypothetical protein [Pseudomonas asplenii]|uniref:hypothetical protein n=1 Tax=Pseudomonas asplenii TaxID=53407 RepID=UPI0006B4A652|nr:hypothetical protein [Pseudomonas fuscovaginae]KPA93720.1 hypothetical protein PF70_06341 [Pseudomonas fuscovaginae]
MNHENRSTTLAAELSAVSSAFESHVIELPPGDNLLPSPAFKADGTSIAELTLKFLQSALPHRTFSQDSLANLSPSQLLWAWLSPGEVNSQKAAALVQSIVHSALDDSPGVENNPRVQAFVTLLSRHFASEHPSTPIGLTPDIRQVQADIIHGSLTAQPPTPGLTLAERERRLDAYATRVRTSLANTERGSEAQRNSHFMTHQPFTRPEGYISAGLLAASLDPQERIPIIYTSATRTLANEERTSSRYERTYAAWEIAAGLHQHDAPDNSGSVLNFQYEQFRSEQDRQRVRDLESLGQGLRDHWQEDVLAALDDVTDAQARRSGEADAYQVKAMLASLRRDLVLFGKTSTATQKAVIRTLDYNGQVIIPNLYGYPLEGYAFIPYQPYDQVHRPNRGLMLDLRNVTISAINGDPAFAHWARNHKGTLLQRFNSCDAQGGRDAHWPSAPNLLDTLIDNPSAQLERPVFQGSFPVRQAFNYTGSATAGYRLKYAPFDTIASLYTQLNARNAQARSQTQLFSSTQRHWRTAQKIWASTFGYIPVVGNIGNLVFGVHELNAGMSAQERLGGSVAILISTLQLAHEVPAIVAGTPPLEDTGSPGFGWKANPQGSEWRFSLEAETLDLVGVESAVEDRETGVEPDTRQPPPALPSVVVTETTVVAQVKDDGSVFELAGKSYIRVKEQVFQSRSSLLGPEQRTIIDPHSESPLFQVHKSSGKWQRLRGLQGGGHCLGKLCYTSVSETEVGIEMHPAAPADESAASDTVLFALSKPQRQQAFAAEVVNLETWLSHEQSLAEFKAIYTRERANPHGFWGPAQSYTDWQAIRRMVRDDASRLPLQDIDHPLPNEMLDEIRQQFTRPPHPTLHLDEEASTRALFDKILVPPSSADDLTFLVGHRQSLRLASYTRRILFKYGLTARQLRLLLSERATVRDTVRTVIDERYPDLRERAEILFNSHEFDLRHLPLSQRKLDTFLECLEDQSITVEKFRLIVQCIDTDTLPLPSSAIYLFSNSRKINILKALDEPQLRQRLQNASTLVERTSSFWRRLRHRNYVVETSATGDPVAILNWSFFKLKRTPVLKDAGQWYVKEQWWPDMLDKRYASFDELEQDLQRRFGGFRQTAATENITLVSTPALAAASYEVERSPQGAPIAVFYRALHEAQTKRVPLVSEAGKLFVVNSDPNWSAVSDRAFSTLGDLERAIREALTEPLEI